MRSSLRKIKMYTYDIPLTVTAFEAGLRLYTYDIPLTVTAFEAGLRQL